MKRLQVVLFLFLIPVFCFSQDIKNMHEQTFFWGISGGLNFTKYANDTISFNYGEGAVLGLYGKYKAFENINLKSSFLYSLKSSNSTSPYLTFRNTYLDFNLIPQYRLLDGLYLQAGISYFNLFSSKIITNHGEGVEKVNNKGFSSDLYIIAGTALRTGKNSSLEFNYFIPTGKSTINNFQLTFNILLNNKSSKHESIRHLKWRKSKEQINQLRNGTLLVRLKTSENKINALMKAGKVEQANEVKKKQAIENREIVSAFRNNLDFCKVAFFYSNHSDSIRSRKFNGIFLNDSLEIDNSIQVDTAQPLFIAEFGAIEQDTSKYFSHYSYEPDKAWSLKQTENYYGGPDFGFDALLIRDVNFIQLSDPFPFYTRAIFKSLKEHPEQAPFIAPILAFQNWSYNQTVEKMNKKLHRFYAKNKIIL